MDYKYILYVKDQCPFCVKAKNMLEMREIGYKAISLDQNLKILEEIKDAYDWNTVPMVFKHSDENCYELVGGFTDLRDHLEKSDEDE